MWLLGPAGAGKSAIAQTLAELCHSLNILLATFFFFRTDPNRNHSRSLFPTIAYQVAINFPDAKDYVARVPEDDPMIFTRSIEEQLSSLIIKPLQELYRSGRATGSLDPYLIIIDGLDECGDPGTQVSLLQVISKALSVSQLPLKILIASRPEVHLMSECNSIIMNPILARLALDDNFLPEDLKTISGVSCGISSKKSSRNTLLLPSSTLHGLPQITLNIWSTNRPGNLYSLRPSSST